MVAEQLLQKRLGEVRLGMQLATDTKKIKYEHLRQMLLDDYRNSGNRSLLKQSDDTETICGLKHLDAFFAGYSIASITPEALQKFIAKRQEAGAENGTINRSLALLRRAFNIAREQGRIQSMPFFKMLKENAPRKGFVEEPQFRRLFDKLPEHLQPLVLFMYRTGCRLGEACKIEWSQVDLDHTDDEGNHRPEIRLHDHQTKSGEARILPLDEELLGMLKRSFRKDGTVFSAVNVRKAWMNACVEAGLGRFKDENDRYGSYAGLLIHDLRRSAVRNMIDAGVDTRTAMAVSGHKTEAVFQRYNIVNSRRVHEAMDKVQEKARRNKSRTSQVKPSTVRKRRASPVFA